jgi:hypothetical protein
VITPLVDFARGPESPEMAPDFRGVTIRLVATAHLGQLRALRLHGAYRVSIDDAREIEAIPLHKALVVTTTATLSYATSPLLGETFAFEDDERTGGGMVTGYFNADLLHLFGPGFEGTGYVVVSLGPFVSSPAMFHTG